MDLEGGALKFDALITRTDFDRQMKAIEDRILGLYDRTEAESKRLDQAFTKLSATITGAFSLAAITGFVQSMVKTRGEFQQIEVAFTTMLKSKAAADQLMKEAVTLAATTPFGLQDVATGAKQLLAYGTEAKNITSTLTMLGNVAAGVSAPLGDIVYLYGTLQTQGRAYSKDIQQFTGRGIPIIKELAAQFGVAESEVMKLVEAGKVGFPEVQKAFQSMTSSSGIFYNLMQEQSKTLTGQLANLSDAWDMMLNSLGKSNDGILSGSIQLATELVENYQKVLDILGILITTYGAYRAAVFLTTIAQSSAIISLGVYDIATKRLIISETLLNVIRNASIKTQRILNATMLANPYVAATVALTALAGIAYVFYKNMDNAVKAQDEVNKAINEGKASVAAETIKIKDNITALHDRTAALSVKKTAINELRKIMPDYLKGYSDEQILAGNATDAIMKYNQALLDTAVSKALFDQKVKLQLDKMKVENMKIDDEDNGFGLTEILFKNKSFNEYKKDRIDAVNALLKANEEATKAQNEKIAEANKKAEQEPIKQDKKYFEAEVEQIKGRIDSLDRLDKDFASKKANLLSELRVAQAGLSSFDTSDKQATKDFDKAKRYAEMLNKVYDLNSKYNNKTLTDDQQKLQEIRDEYKNLQRDIDEYNKDPKNKKVNPNLKPALEKAIENKQYEIDTENLKSSLDKQKQLYSEYEDYKYTVGKEAADKRFATELDTSFNYIEKLKNERDKILSKGIINLSQPERERVTLFNDEIRSAVNAETKKQDELTKSLISYQEQRLNLKAKYEQDLNALENNAQAKAERKSRFDEDLKDLDDSHIKNLDAYKRLFDGIDQLSEENARKVIANAGNLLDQLIKQGIGSPELHNEIARLLKQSTDALDQRLPGRLVELGSQIDEIANSVSSVDEAFGKVLGTLGNVLNKVGNIKKGMDDFKKFGESKDSLGQLGAGLGILGAGMSIFQSLFKLFDRSAQREAEAKYSRDIQNRQQEASNKLLERQISLIDEAYGTDRILKYDQALKTARESEKKYAADVADNFKITGDLLTDSFLKQINEGADPKKIKGGDFFKRDAFLDKFYKGQFSKIGDISKLTVQELKALAEGGPIDEGTQKLVENLINAKQAAIDLTNKLNAENVGQSLESLADNFISTLTDGVGDFGKSFEDTIRKSILNGFKSKFIQDQLQAFYQQFADLSEGGLTKEEIAALKLEYDKAQAAGEQKLKDLEAISGVKLTDSGSDPSAIKPNTLTASMNQPTAERLEGLWRGQYDLTTQIKTNSIELMDLNRRQLELSEKFGLGFQDQQVILNNMLFRLANIDNNTLRSANNTDRLQNIENTLSSIEKNTGTKTTRD
ncbi:tape measure protein [Pedobacter panaciterrae]